MLAALKVAMLMTQLLVINGPNLKALGNREPGIYGARSYAELVDRLTLLGLDNNCPIKCVQSNHEGQIIDWLHEAGDRYDGIILNAGAFTHYSYAIRDAIASINTAVIEVHISNVHARESFRHLSVIAPVVAGQITGLGLEGYELACRYFWSINQQDK